jgi:hypothetical protein
MNFNRNNPLRMLSQEEWQNIREKRRKRKYKRARKKAKRVGKFNEYCNRFLLFLKSILPNTRRFCGNYILFCGGIPWNDKNLSPDIAGGFSARGILTILIATFDATIIGTAVAFLSQSQLWGGIAAIGIYFGITSLERAIFSSKKIGFFAVLPRLIAAVGIASMVSLVLPIVFSRSSIEQIAVEKLEILDRIYEAEKKIANKTLWRIDPRTVNLPKREYVIDENSKARMDAIQKKQDRIAKDIEQIKDDPVQSSALSFEEQAKTAYESTFPSSFDQKQSNFYEESTLATQENLLGNPSSKSVLSTEKQLDRQLLSEQQLIKAEEIHKRVSSSRFHLFWHSFWLVFGLILETTPLMLWLADKRDNSWYDQLDKAEEHRKSNRYIRVIDEEKFEQAKWDAERSEEYLRNLRVAQNTKIRENQYREAGTNGSYINEDGTFSSSKEQETPDETDTSGSKVPFSSDTPESPNVSNNDETPYQAFVRRQRELR